MFLLVYQTHDNYKQYKQTLNMIHNKDIKITMLRMQGNKFLKLFAWAQPQFWYPLSCRNISIFFAFGQIDVEPIDPALSNQAALN